MFSPYIKYMGKTLVFFIKLHFHLHFSPMFLFWELDQQYKHQNLLSLIQIYYHLYYKLIWLQNLIKSQQQQIIWKFKFIFCWEKIRKNIFSVSFPLKIKFFYAGISYFLEITWITLHVNIDPLLAPSNKFYNGKIAYSLSPRFLG